MVSRKKQNENKIVILMDKAARLAYNENYIDALKVADKAVKLDPENEDAINLKLLLCAELGNAEEYIKCCDMLTRINHDDNSYLIRKATLLEGLGRYEEALESYDDAEKLGKNEDLIWYNRGVIYLYYFKRYEKAIECFTESLKINPNAADAWANLSNCYRGLDDLNEAMVCCDEALKIDSNFLHALHNKGSILNDWGCYEEAIRYYDKILAIQPDNEEVLISKENALESLDDLSFDNLEEVFEYLDSRLKNNPNDYEALINKGIFLTRSEKYVDAYKIFNKALEINPSDEHVWFYKGENSYYMGLNLSRNLKNLSMIYLEDALDNFNKALEINPNNEDALIRKGIILSRLGHYEDSLQILNHVSSSYPQDLNILSSMIFSLKKLNRLDEAMEIIEKALKIDPANEGIWNMKGNILAILEHYEEALNSFIRILMINPENEDAMFKKGLCLGKLGRFDEEKEVYDEILRVNPHNEKVLKIIKQSKGIDLDSLLSRANKENSDFNQKKNYFLLENAKENKLQVDELKDLDEYISFDYKNGENWFYISNSFEKLDLKYFF